MRCFVRRLSVALLAPAIGCGHASATTTTRTVTADAAGKTMIAFGELAATPAPPADHREAYGAGPQQFGELRLPARRGRVPIVVLVHGGCWRAAYDLTHVAAAAASLAGEGYAVWVPEYRRVGDDGGGWPGTFEDIANAVDFVRTLAGRYPIIDTTRVILAGHSAGGQLALWAASRRTVSAMPTAAATHAPLAVAGVVALAAITDLAEYGVKTTGCNSAVTPLMGGTAADVPDRYRAVSPIERLPLGVPVRLIHGADDPIVPVTQSRLFAARSTLAGGKAELVEVPAAGHFDVVATQSTSWPAVLAAVRALVASGRH